MPIDMPCSPSYSEALAPIILKAFITLDMQPPVVDPDLMRRVAQRDEAAFDALYDRYAGLVFGVANKMLGSHADAEEVVIDAFAQAWRTADTYDARKSRVDSWLLMIARSRALDRLRQRAREGRIEDASVQQATEAPVVTVTGPEDEVLANERGAAVRQALGDLPEPQRRALELAYYKGLSQTEIAEATGEALGTVKTRMRLGLGKLRESLAGWWSV
jgi:RNA polymerase sigma-70 factor (ECF subfamily)